MTKKQSNNEALGIRVNDKGEAYIQIPLYRCMSPNELLHFTTMLATSELDQLITYCEREYRIRNRKQ